MEHEKKANEVAKMVHRAICDAGIGLTDMNADGSISQEDTTALINGGVWGVAAFIAQSVVISNVPDAPDGVTADELMANEVRNQFLHAYRAYVAQQAANAN